VPAAAGARLGWVVMDGSLDGVFGTQDPPATGATQLGIRWSNLWTYPSLPQLLLTALLPLLVLAAATLAGRPRALVPPATARRVATVVAAGTAVLGVAGVAGFVAQTSGLLPVITWSSPTGSKVDGFAPAAAAVLVTAVVGVAATGVLWPREHRAPAGAGGADGTGVPLPDGAGPEDAGFDGGRSDDAGSDDAGSGRAALGSAVPEPAGAPPELPGARSLPALPTVASADLDLYRRR